MSDSTGRSKHDRMLELCMRLVEGEFIKKKQESERYQVNERSIQRDIDNLRTFFSEKSIREDIPQEVIYDRVQKGYRLQRSNKKDLTNGEALSVSKILLESRAFTKDELFPILDKIVRGCIPKKNLKQVTDLLSNEKFYYIEPRHGQSIMDKLWEIGSAVRDRRLVLIEYAKLKDNATVQRLIKPVGIMFSEFYFYLTAFIENIDKEKEFENKDDLFPTIYRFDRIQSFKVLNEHFEIPYKDRFQEGEFRKRVQFMYGGTLQRIKFEYSGPSIEAVLDRLPTAVIENEKNGVYTVTAEVFGKGIDMWLGSQGEFIKKLT